jgi:hypothetical protein
MAHDVSIQFGECVVSELVFFLVVAALAMPGLVVKVIERMLVDDKRLPAAADEPTPGVFSSNPHQRNAA